ncbi:phosphoesterase [Deinococcus radiotolerans]|uniref:Phosphoesterase n=1 Tax=Deinococcus radiotolerans TaxID=1309407 RepID=A0ABQ2FDV5_9DEIO|nr:phosphoesterase [Deinococcus radiotolerans]
MILSHENPDGDALGSVLGLARALRQLGREVIAPMHVPRFLAFMPRDGELSGHLSEWPADALAAVLDVDNNDPVRVAGADLSTFSGPVVNVDHHGTNARRADALAVDPAQPAAAAMIAELVDLLGATWTEEIATPLMLGLITDTGSFRFESVTPAAFQTAATLRAAGARLGWINDHLGQNPQTYYTLLREVLGTLQVLHDGRVVLVRVDGGMLERTGAAWEDVENYVGMFRNVEGSQLAVMVKDFGERVKVSLRSRAGLSAQNVAVALGGGGHVPAAGASLNLTWPEAFPLLDAAIQAELRRVDDLNGTPRPSGSPGAP